MRDSVFLARREILVQYYHHHASSPRGKTMQRQEEGKFMRRWKIYLLTLLDIKIKRTDVVSHGGSSMGNNNNNNNNNMQVNL